MATTPRYGQTEPSGQSNTYRNNRTNKPDPDDGSVYTGVTPGLAFTTIDNSGYAPYGGEYENRREGDGQGITTSEDISGASYQRTPGYTPPIVIEPGYFLESVPYPIYYQESMTADSELLEGDKLQNYTVESMESDASIEDGELVTLLLEYEDWPEESIEADGFIEDGELVTLLVEYENWPEESIEADASIEDGELETVLIQYQNWPEESMEADGEIMGGSLV